MAATGHPQGRREEVSRWILTSIALSLVLHVLLVHYLGNFRLFDVEDFSASVSRWFHVVEIPRSLPPEIASYVENLPTQADKPEEPKPFEIPLQNPEKQIETPVFPNERDLAKSAHLPTTVRLPDSEQAVVHREGQPNTEQTNAQIGQVAPVRATGTIDVAPAGAGGREVLEGATGVPVPLRMQLALSEVMEARPAAQTHAGQLTAPDITPSPTAIDLGAPAPQGLVIPLEDSIARKETERPPVLVFPTNPIEDEDTGPIIPLADEVAVKMDIYAKPGEPVQYFRVEIAVAKPDQLPVIPKDVMFICDVSLSIRRDELAATRRAIAAYLRQLRTTDRFNVVVFSEEARKLFPDFVEPTPERVAAVSAFVDRIPGQIKTDVYRVLRAVVRDVAEQSVRNRPTNIFFVSDGCSTQGVRDVRRIVNEISAFARPNFAILPFDAGRGGDRYLLDLLAYRSRGQLTCTDDAEEAERIEHTLFATFDKPTLMQLRLLYTNLDVAETYPAFVPSLYADRPIVIYGRCKPGQNVTIQLQGKNPYARRALQFSHAPGAPDPSRTDIAREWARQKIHHIVSDMARVGATPELKAELERLSREYDVHTPYNP